jgi:hypothetical protein
LLNASIENLIGFLDDDPIAYRKVGLSDIVKNSKVRSKELVKGPLKDSKYTKYNPDPEPSHWFHSPMKTMTVLCPAMIL